MDLPNQQATVGEEVESEAVLLDVDGSPNGTALGYLLPHIKKSLHQVGGSSPPTVLMIAFSDRRSVDDRMREWVRSESDEVAEGNGGVDSRREAQARGSDLSH